MGVGAGIGDASKSEEGEGASYDRAKVEGSLGDVNVRRD